ncbi:hypothetical protein O5O45_11045 [Hahella aquimaris]|uniref:hypothetical protein n=1 Tax=Hahella sp. HNIBRBA332 TaxID=3015983 RepID=UPI00273C7FD6|nr:hypothetical protein [Hahella sp. HNIBRBA332]WLQ16456.1 hypothetical protein O5O45_11045 [Hahella sp. HNIBRBA332]
MPFDEDLFLKTYTPKNGFSSLSDEQKGLLREELNRQMSLAARSFQSAEQEAAENDGFVTVQKKSTKSTSKAMSKGAQRNPNKTGAVMVGILPKSKKLVSVYRLSGSEYSDLVNKLRTFLDINPEKATYCAEENIIAANPGVRFLAASAFRLDDNGATYKIPACGYGGKPSTKCKLTLGTLDIQEVEWQVMKE